MGAEFRNFTGRFLADINRDADHDDESADENERDQPGGNMSDSQARDKNR